MKKNLSILAVFAVLLLAIVSNPAQAAWINKPAPDFTLSDLEGNQVSLSDFRGRVVFIDFWASWCSPCKKEYPELKKLVTDYKRHGVVVLAINVDKKRSHVDDFLSSHGSIPENLIVLLDPETRVITAYSAKAMPTSFIVDKEGQISSVHYGFNERDPDTWRSEIDKLLK